MVQDFDTLSTLANGTMEDGIDDGCGREDRRAGGWRKYRKSF